MGSTFTYNPNNENSSLFNDENDTKHWLQFVPGIVVQVITSRNTPGYNDERDINSIIAKSHADSAENIQFSSMSNSRYYPLFRGIVDVPVNGDPVLLCTFGGINYYIGPLNTQNKPNFNIDNLNNAERITIDTDMDINTQAYNNKSGISRGFRRMNHSRLHKPYNYDLDDIDESQSSLGTHGDMMFEGRHGNSFRLGSRDYKPYIIFSNGRGDLNPVESALDDTILLMSSYGSIHNHFPNDVKFQDGESENPQEREVEEFLFQLGSDLIEEPKRMIGGEIYDYEYNGPQLFQNSDRITINSRSDNIFISSFRDIFIGAGNTFNIFTENETIIESSNIYLGKQAKTKKDEGEEVEPLVLGNKLKIFLEELVGILEVAHALVQGVPVPITDSTAAPLLPKIQSLKNKLSSPEFWSEYHFIEDNGQKQ